MQSSDADAENMDNDILNVSCKTFKHLLNLMQRNALNFAALERLDANSTAVRVVFLGRDGTYRYVPERTGTFPICLKPPSFRGAAFSAVLAVFGRFGRFRVNPGRFGRFGRFRPFLVVSDRFRPVSIV
jgi:hypothetical protein